MNDNFAIKTLDKTIATKTFSFSYSQKLVEGNYSKKG